MAFEYGGFASLFKDASPYRKSLQLLRDTHWIDHGYALVRQRSILAEGRSPPSLCSFGVARETRGEIHRGLRLRIEPL